MKCIFGKDQRVIFIQITTSKGINWSIIKSSSTLGCVVAFISYELHRELVNLLSSFLGKKRTLSEF